MICREIAENEKKVHDIVSYIFKEQEYSLLFLLNENKKGTLYKSMLEVIEKPLIEYVLERNEGNQLKTARILGINRNTLRTKIKKLGIHIEKK